MIFNARSSIAWAFPVARPRLSFPYRALACAAILAGAPLALGAAGGAPDAQGPQAPPQTAAARIAGADDNKPGASRPFQLTVDSIMRGPDLVGWAPAALRWSSDSQK